MISYRSLVRPQLKTPTETGIVEIQENFRKSFVAATWRIAFLKALS